MELNAKKLMEEESFIESLKSDRERREIQLQANKIWNKTALKNYIANGNLKTILKRYAYYSPEELEAKFTEEYITNQESISDFEDEMKSKVNVICDNLIPSLSSDALEYIRYKIIEQELLSYPVEKNVDPTAIATVINLLKDTNIANYYPNFKETFDSRAILGKCFTEKYLDEYVFAAEGTSNFKHFIDKLFRLYNQFIKLDKKNAETKFIELINATLKSSNCVLLIISKKENTKSFISINVESVVFAKNNYPKFYTINQPLCIEIIKQKDRANLKIQNRSIILSNSITTLVKDVYQFNEIGAYKKLATNIINVLIKEKVLEKRSETDALCKICNRRRATGFRNQKICKDCIENINLIVGEAGFEFDSVKNALINSKVRAIKRYKKYTNNYTIISWLEYLDEEN